jgi:hypothetical protein
MVTLNEARRVIAAAEKKAAEIRQPMNIDIAINKAFTMQDGHHHSAVQGDSQAG